MLDYSYEYCALYCIRDAIISY